MPSWNRRRCLSGMVACSAIVFGLATGAQASSITYTYTGTNLTSSFGAVPAGLGPIVGSFTLPAPLPANLTNQAFNPNTLIFSFSDGLHTYPASGIGLFEVGTDSGGNINAWNLQVNGSCLPVDGPDCSNILLEVQNGFIGSYNAVYDQNAAFQTIWVSSGPPGTWAFDSIAAVPEPTSLLLSLTGLVGLTTAMATRRSS